MKHVQVTLIVAALTTVGLSGAAFGQYVWLDEKGVKQYSDMPPPAAVPHSRILKQPGGSRAVDASPAGDDIPATADTSRPQPPMTTAEKNADFQKRRAEQAEKEKKSAEEARQASEKTRYCERSREYQRSLESGQRITSMDRNGERSFMSDEQRARELGDTKRALQDCK
jgi:hypothetical protein